MEIHRNSITNRKELHDDFIKRKLKYAKALAQNNPKNLYSIDRLVEIFGGTKAGRFEQVMEGQIPNSKVLIKKEAVDKTDLSPDDVMVYLHPFFTTRKTLARFLEIDIEEVYRLEEEGIINEEFVILQPEKMESKNA